MRKKNCPQPIRISLGDICDQFIRDPQAAYLLHIVGDRLFYRDNLINFNKEKTQTNLFANIINKTKSQIKVERKGFSKQLNKISNSAMKSKSPLSRMKGDRNQSQIVMPKIPSEAQNYQTEKKGKKLRVSEQKIGRQRFKQSIQKQQGLEHGYFEYENRRQPQTVSWNIKNKIVRSKVKQNMFLQAKETDGLDLAAEQVKLQIQGERKLEEASKSNRNLVDFSFMNSFADRNNQSIKDCRLAGKISQVIEIEESIIVERREVVKSDPKQRSILLMKQISENLNESNQKLQQVSCRISNLKQPDEIYIKSILNQKIGLTDQMKSPGKQVIASFKEDSELIQNPYAKVDQQKIQNSNGLLSELQKRKSNLTDEEFCKIYSSFKKAEKLSQAFDISDIDIDKLLKIKKQPIKTGEYNLRSLKIMEVPLNEVQQKEDQHCLEKETYKEYQPPQKTKRKRPTLKLSLGTSFIPHYELYPSPRSPQSRQILAQFKVK